MPALAEPGVRVDRDWPVLVGEGDDRDSRLLHDPGKETPAEWSQLRRQDHPGFGQGRSPGAGGARRELVDECLPARLPENDRDQRRRVDDQDALTDRQRIARSVKPQVSSGRPADPVSWWRVLEEFGKVRRPGEGLSRLMAPWFVSAFYFTRAERRERAKARSCRPATCCRLDRRACPCAPSSRHVRYPLPVDARTGCRGRPKGQRHGAG